MKKSQLRQIIREVIRESWYEKNKDGSVKSNLDKGSETKDRNPFRFPSGGDRRAAEDEREARIAAKIAAIRAKKGLTKEAWDAKTEKDKAKRDADVKNKDRQAKGWEMDRQKKMENALHALNDKIQPAIHKNKWVNKDIPEKEFLAKTGLSLSQLASYRHIFERAFPVPHEGMDFDLISYDPSHRIVYVKDPMDV